MPDQETPPRLDATLYPEIVSAGGLVSALDAHFDRLGVALRGRAHPDPDIVERVATVGDGERHTKVTLVWRERKFWVSVQARQRMLAQGFAPDLAVVADTAARWQGGADAAEVAAVWQYLGSVQLAGARERGDAVEAAWLSLYENHTGNAVHARLHAFVALAFYELRLRRLRPYTSHWMLVFSRSPTFPWSRDCPSVDPLEPGSYRVRTADGRELGVADATGSLALVLAALDTVAARQLDV
jgi:hypothetical protein